MAGWFLTCYAMRITDARKKGIKNVQRNEKGKFNGAEYGLESSRQYLFS